MAIVCCLFCAATAPAQRLGITKGFKVLGETFDAPHDTQPRSLLEGATAQSLENGNQLLTGVKLQTFRETGERELFIKAPQCLYDRVAKSASSGGPLSVETADGKFYIEGEGFLCQQTNSSLIISNKVRTRIAAEMLESSTDDSRPKAGEPKTGPIEITADYFEYSRSSGVSVYRRNVHVSGTNQLSLTSQLLEIQLPMEPRQLQSIRAQQDVSLEYNGVQATGQEAVYSAQAGAIRLTGQPTWRVDQRQGSADILTVERTNKIFRAEGNAWLRAPAQGLTIAGLLNQTNEATRAAQKAANQFVEVRSHAYEFHTNWAVFEREVRLQELVDGQVRGTMNCGLLSASFKGSNQLETLTASTNVLIKDGTNWLSCDHALLTGSNGLLEATGAPAWGAGSRTGKGNLVRINTRANEMLVQGNASIQLPARELADAAEFNARSTDAKPAASLATNDLAQIFCEEYTLSPTKARFHGGVYATHPRMNWTCNSLAIDLAPAGGRKQTLTAEQGVKFQLSGEKGGLVEGTGDRAVYIYGVEASVTNDLLTLTGSPASLQTTNGMVRNTTIIYDRARNVLSTPGAYAMSGTNKPLATNLLVLPKPKLTR